MARLHLFLSLLLVGLILSACGDTVPSPSIGAIVSPVAKNTFSSAPVPTPTVSTGFPPSSATSQAVATTPGNSTVTNPPVISTLAATPTEFIQGDPVPKVFSYVAETNDSGATWSLLINQSDPSGKVGSSNSYQPSCLAQNACFNLDRIKDSSSTLYYELVREGSGRWKYFSKFNTEDISCISFTECIKLEINKSPEGVFGTNDGGATWNELTRNKELKTNAANTALYLKMRRSEAIRGELEFTHSISCVKGVQCLTVGQGRAIRTLDSGQTWEWFSTGAANYRELICFNEAICYASSETSIDFTTNFGETWQRFSLPKNSYKFGVLNCPTLTFCVVAAENGLLLTTSDKGASWTERSGTSHVAVVDVSCPDDTNCYAITMEGNLLVTHSSWKTWEEKTLNLENFEPGFSKISCPSPTNCFINYSKFKYN